MHHKSAIDPDTNKPESIIEYNSTKGQVDTVDKMCTPILYLQHKDGLWQFFPVF